METKRLEKLRKTGNWAHGDALVVLTKTQILDQGCPTEIEHKPQMYSAVFQFFISDCIFLNWGI